MGKGCSIALHPFCFVISLFHKAHLVKGILRINGATPIKGRPQDIIQQQLCRTQIQLRIFYDK